MIRYQRPRAGLGWPIHPFDNSTPDSGRCRNRLGELADKQPSRKCSLYSCPDGRTDSRVLGTVNGGGSGGTQHAETLRSQMAAAGKVSPTATPTRRRRSRQLIGFQINSRPARALPFLQQKPATLSGRPASPRPLLPLLPRSILTASKQTDGAAASYRPAPL